MTLAWRQCSLSARQLAPCLTLSVQLPSQYGVILRRTPSTEAAITRLRQHNAQLPRNEDEFLAGFWVAGNPNEVDRMLQELRAEGLKERVDFVLTGSADGVLGNMPTWLQEDEPGGSFSVPGTGAAPLTTPRLTWQQELAMRRRETRVELVAAMRAADAAARRRWPELTGGDVERFLGDCWALVEFVEKSRTGGPARTWVRENFPDLRWHIPVWSGYKDELQALLRTYYQSSDKASALTALRRRAGLYIGALETGASRGTVDTGAFDAWKARFATTPAR